MSNLIISAAVGVAVGVSFMTMLRIVSRLGGRGLPVGEVQDVSPGEVKITPSGAVSSKPSGYAAGGQFY